jgi:hypothetical protein
MLTSEKWQNILTSDIVPKITPICFQLKREKGEREKERK